jgi:hypothetical protein
LKSFCNLCAFKFFKRFFNPPFNNFIHIILLLNRLIIDESEVVIKEKDAPCAGSADGLVRKRAVRRVTDAPKPACYLATRRYPFSRCRAQADKAIRAPGARLSFFFTKASGRGS